MMTLKTRTSLFLVPIVFCTMGMMTLFFAGCSREEAKPVAAEDSSSPAVYMKDTAFRGELKKLQSEREDLMAVRGKIVEQMKAKVDAAKARLKTSDEKLVKAELEKDPEWRSLHARCVDLNTVIAEQRRKTMDTVRERIAPKKVRGDNSLTSGKDSASPLEKAPLEKAPLEKVPKKAEKISK